MRENRNSSDFYLVENVVVWVEDNLSDGESVVDKRDYHLNQPMTEALRRKGAADRQDPERPANVRTFTLRTFLF